MSTVLSPPRLVQACYTTPAGMVIREDGKSRPATLDEIEQAYSQAKLDEVMSSPGAWIDLCVPIILHSCRCWTRRRNEDTAVVILPGVGKVECRTLIYAGPAGIALFNKVCEAETLAWRLPLSDPNRGKGYVELTAAEIEALKADAATTRPLPFPTLRHITRQVRTIDLSQFAGPTNPAA